jgi:hypothetical protein
VACSTFNKLKKKDYEIHGFFFQSAYLEQMANEDGQSILGMDVRHDEVAPTGF